MQETVGVYQKASDTELMTLLRRAQEEIDAHSELNEVNLLLRDFARELLKKRLLIRAQFEGRVHAHNQRRARLAL